MLTENSVSFLSTIFPPTARGYLNICTPREESTEERKPLKSKWFNLSDAGALDAAVAYAVTTNESGGEVWYMTSLSGGDLGEYRKGKEIEMTTATCLHADVDVGNEGHKAVNNPPTIEDGQTIIASAPLPPSMIVHSGHGMQPYWLLDAPMDVTTPDSRKRFKALLKGWQGVMQSFAHGKGWHMDGTSNLDRVLRIAGTRNLKREPVPVQLLPDSPMTRYSLEQLEAALQSVQPVQQADEIDFTGPVSPACPVATLSNVTTSQTAADGWDAVGAAHDDDAIIRMASSAKNGDKFRTLFNGSEAGYPSTSEAVMGLACLLAFYTRSHSQIESIMGRSKLCAPYEKWQRPDFRTLTIKKALEKVTAGNVASSKPTATAAADAVTTEKPKQSQADMLVKMCDGDKIEFWHDKNRKPYATFLMHGHTENCAVRSSDFSEFLARIFYKVHKKALTEKSLSEALGTLSSRAIFDGPEREVGIRLAGDDSHVYLDLANEAWEVVTVSADGWHVTTDCPVRFIRKPGMLPLPSPTKGGSLDDLRPLLNASDDDTWRLLCGWLVGTFQADGPYPVLVVNGEQGSAKSTMCRMLRSLVDPNEADLRALPKNEQDLLIAATNSHLVAFDNLSSLKADLSDSLCRLATGSSFSTRRLYSDDEEQIFSASRPVLINGIDDCASRADLLERSIVITLPPLPSSARITEKALAQKFEAARSGILGALCNAVSSALTLQSTIALPELPRMADFSTWVVAAEKCLPWKQGEFMLAYKANQAHGQSIALDQSAFGSAVVALLEKDMRGNGWTGTPGRLLQVLSEDKDNCKARDFPQTAKGVSVQLKRLTPSLRSQGIEVEWGGHTEKGNTVTIRDTRTGDDADEDGDGWAGR